MVGVAQILKMSAEGNYVDNYVEGVEAKFETLLNEKPTVQSSKGLNLEQLSKFR